MAVIGMAWYKRADYPRILEIMEDPEVLPITLDRWQGLAEKGEAKQRALGHTVHRAYIDPENFVAWCTKGDRDVDAKARVAWANLVAIRKERGEN